MGASLLLKYESAVKARQDCEEVANKADAEPQVIAKASDKTQAAKDRLDFLKEAQRYGVKVSEETEGVFQIADHKGRPLLIAPATGRWCNKARRNKWYRAGKWASFFEKHVCPAPEAHPPRR